VAMVGSAIVGLGTIPFAFATTTTNEWYLMAVLLVRGFGLAAVMIPLSAVAFAGLRHDEIPHAGIVTRVAQRSEGLLVLLCSPSSSTPPSVVWARTRQPPPAPLTGHSGGRSDSPGLHLS
jgi:hypothetical protein